MAARHLTNPLDLSCPYCKTVDFLFSGIQRGYGYVPDMALWTCRGCGSTFSLSSPKEGNELEEKIGC